MGSGERPAELRVWIPMADGVRLAATLYLPEQGPSPVLLEALPYRKDDVTANDRSEYRRLRDQHGYAVCRVDLRGTGSSEGLATDEYPPGEQDDLCRVIAWLADQPWSTGAVGMYGTSYSGFNWLRGHDNGVDRDPPVTVFVRHPTRPAPDLDRQAGVWRSEPAWPPARATELSLPLGKGSDRLEVRPDVGSAAWSSCAGHLPFGQPDDQRTDDAWSLTVDRPLDRELEVLGHPRLRVRVAASAPVAFLSAKLCDLFPDGTSALVARGFLNLTHRRSHTDPEPLQPGWSSRSSWSWTPPRGCVPRRAPAAAVAGGVGLAQRGAATRPGDPHGRTGRLRAAAAPVDRGATSAPPPPGPPGAVAFAAGSPSPAGSPGPPVVWKVVRDVLGRTTEAVIGHGGRSELEDGTVVSERYRGTVGAALDPPGASWATGEATYRLAWLEATVASSARLELRGDADAFDVRVDLEVGEEGQPPWTRSWRRRIPRRLG
jgi:uncharacterized protein